MFHFIQYTGEEKNASGLLAKSIKEQNELDVFVDFMSEDDTKYFRESLFYGSGFLFSNSYKKELFKTIIDEQNGIKYRPQRSLSI